MNKIVKYFQKNYIYANLTVFLLTLYVILFPFIAKILEKINPLFVQCPYLRVTGKPCPLCGGTRYIMELPNAINDITYLFHPFGIIMISVICEFIFRIYNIITREKEKSERYVRNDIIVILALIAYLILYEIIYMIMQK